MQVAGLTLERVRRERFDEAGCMPFSLMSHVVSEVSRFLGGYGLIEVRALSNEEISPAFAEYVGSLMR